MEYLDCAAGRLAYHVPSPSRPDAPTVVALHSGAASGRQWRALAACLAPDWQLVAPDMIGYGGTPLKASVTLDDEMALLTGLADLIDGPFHLVGHSYGGFMALELARRLPERVMSLALYEPVCIGLLHDAGSRDALREANIRVGGAVELAVAGRAMDAAECFIDYWVGKGAFRTMSPDQQQYVAGCMHKAADEWRILTAPIEADHFAGLTMPVLLLAGGATTLAARRIAERLRPMLPDLRCATLPGLGHMAPLSQPDRVNPVLMQFFAEMAGRRPRAFA